MTRPIIAAVAGLSLLSATIHQAWKDGAHLNFLLIGTPAAT